MWGVRTLAALIICITLTPVTYSTEVGQQQRLGRQISSADTGGSSYLSDALDTLATWLSGWAELNPRFGAQEVHTRADWEVSTGTASPLVVHKPPAAASQQDGTSGVDNGGATSGTSDGSSTGKAKDLPERQDAAWPKRQDSIQGQKGGRKAGSRLNRHQTQQTSKRVGANATAAVAAGEAAVADFRELPMIALMFLTRGDLPHERTWRLFLESLPLKGPGKEPGWKRMFSLYVHPGQDHSFASASLFHGSAISKREKVEWGQFSVMQAERNLMEAALLQPLNERFVLLSETCIPLYPAALVWAQLLSQPTSRIHACAVPNNSDDEGRRMLYRMHHEMEQKGAKEGLTRGHWRKSGQWIALIRRHAQAVVDDTFVSKLFKDECWVDTEHNPVWRFCVSDEHYVPTLLAYLGQDNQTDCTGAVTNAWWDGPYYHPRTWEVADISADLLSNLRKTNNGFAPNEGVKCTSQEALQSVRAMLPPSKALDRPKGRRRMLMQRARKRSRQKLHGVLGDGEEREAAVGNQLPEPLWMQLAVLQPGSLEWWQLLDERGIDGDQLLGDDEISTTTRRKLAGAGEEGVGGEGRHWEAARGMLAQYSPMEDVNCPLFARKFSKDGADGVAEVVKPFVSSESEARRRHRE